MIATKTPSVEEFLRTPENERSEYARGEQCYNACFNRRMRKTARPVVWEGDGAQSPSLDPISALCARTQRLISLAQIVRAWGSDSESSHFVKERGARNAEADHGGPDPPIAPPKNS